MYYLLLGKENCRILDDFQLILRQCCSVIATYFPDLQNERVTYIFFFCKLLSHMKPAEKDSGLLSLRGSAKLPLNSVHQLFFWSIIQDYWHCERGALAAAKSPREGREARQQHGSKTEQYEWGSKWCYFHTRCTSLKYINPWNPNQMIHFHDL